MPIVINSDIFIDALRGSDQAKELLKNLSAGKEIYYSTFTVAELLSSKMCDDQKIRESTMKIFSVFENAPVDDIISRKAAYFRRKYSLLLPDAIIAATAHQLKADLLTANPKDFSRLKEIRVRNPY